MILTKEIFEQGKSSRGGYNSVQIKTLGIQTTHNRGWKHTIIGKDFPEETIHKFLASKDARTGPLREEYIKERRKMRGTNKFVPIPKTVNISWKDQYLHPNWQKFRQQVLKRDKFKCVSCKDMHTTLHVHHLKYIKGAFIWEVPLFYTATLCEVCHSEEHNRDVTAKQNLKKYNQQA